MLLVSSLEASLAIDLCDSSCFVCLIGDDESVGIGIIISAAGLEVR